MSRRGGYRAGTAAALGVLGVLGVLVASAAVAIAVTIGGAETGGAGTGGAGTGAAGQAASASVLDASVTGPAAAVTDQVSAADQGRAVAHWTRRRMLGATATAVPRGLIRTSLPAVTRTPGLVTRTPSLPGAGRGPGLPGASLAPGLSWAGRSRAGRSRAGRAPEQPSRGSGEITAPKGIPTASPFSGSPTTGALFYTTGGKGHFCSASVVDSTADDLALTAAHCVYAKGFATNIEYVPGYHDGKYPYGAWPVRAITVASGWKLSHDPDLDFAFLILAAAGGKQIQAKTGGLTLGFTRWYSEKIEVIGHNDSGAAPIRCATRSFRFRTGQMEFYCHGFWTGTSGGPWIIGYNSRNGTGTVFGVIGGYELGGDYEWASYSAYFGSAARLLYEQVERAAGPRPTPTPTPTKTPTTGPTTASPTASLSPTPSTIPTGAPPMAPAAGSPTPTATAPFTTYPTALPSGATGMAGSGVTSAPTTTPSPTGSVSITYRAPKLPG